jgi:hypothetical protein
MREPGRLLTTASDAKQARGRVDSRHESVGAHFLVNGSNTPSVVTQMGYIKLELVGGTCRSPKLVHAKLIDVFETAA